MSENYWIFVSEDKPEIMFEYWYGYEALWSPSYERWYGQKMIANPRELKVLSEEFGEVSRKTLEINLGKQEEIQLTKGWLYDLKDILLIEEIIGKEYSQLVRKKLYKGMLPLVRSLLATQSENEFRAILVEHELSKE